LLRTFRKPWWQSSFRFVRQIRQKRQNFATPSLVPESGVKPPHSKRIRRKIVRVYSCAFVVNLYARNTPIRWRTTIVNIAGKHYGMGDFFA
jgi:hypothetical protein